MLSYRHAFHAGNHADILKHYTLFQTLNYYNQKDKPYWYIDTHSGAGAYSLQSKEAQKVGEYHDGILRLQQTTRLPENLAAFRDHLANHQDAQSYHGSPLLAQSLIRPYDKMRLFELHPSDYALLQHNLSAHSQQVRIAQSDGYKGLISLLPPPTRRAVILIDPPYERKQEYQMVADTLKQALKRFATGTYLIWYPCLSHVESQRLPEKLQQLAPKWLQIELHVKAPAADGFGMHGSGMFIINPPYTFKNDMSIILPILAQILSQDASAHFLIQYSPD